MAINDKLLDQINDFFGDLEMEEWLINNTDISIDETSKSITLTIQDLNEQEFSWFKDLM